MRTVFKGLNTQCGRWVAPIAVSLWASVAFAAPPPAGIAPVTTPSGGLAIDGDLVANTPSGSGDWTMGTNSGAGGALLDAAGLPLNPKTTFHFTDAFNDTGDMIFSGGLKWTDDPNVWTATTGKPSSKTDINNVLLHIATDANGHTWAIVSADRASTSGESYIDFEFLQNTLIRTTTNKFISAGPNGGRTANDLLLSLAFGGGGKVADFFAWRWLSDGKGGFAYVDSTASFPAGSVFAALNTNTVAVPYGAFGTNVYAPNAFAEAAIDLTALLGAFDPCLSIGVKTIMVKTKASTSSSASIEDMIDPIQYSISIGPGADPGTNQTRCSEGALTSFPLYGVAHPGLSPIASTQWTVVSGTASIDSPNSLVTTAQVASGSATLRLTVVQVNGCSSSKDVVLTVAPLPANSINGPATICPSGTATFQGPAGMSGYAWSISGNGTISGPANGASVSVSAGPLCGEPFSLVLTVMSNSCSAPATWDVLVADTKAPTVYAPADLTLECPADTRPEVTGVATAQDECGEATVTFSDDVVTTCGLAKVISRTWKAVDPCGNVATALQTITVRDTVPPVLTVPANRTLECPADTDPSAAGLATATDACGTADVTFTDAVNALCGSTKVITRTWKAVDQCNNTAIGVQTITVKDTTPPVLTLPKDIELECPANIDTSSTGVATATDACGTATVTFTDDVKAGCGGTKTVTRTWKAVDECNNAATGVQTITVKDVTAPVLSLPKDVVLECPADTEPAATGNATAADACGSATISHKDVVVAGCGATKVITRTWTAVDECGNAATGDQKITVRDTTMPVLTVPKDITVECPGSTLPDETGTATATDSCGTVQISSSDATTTACGGTKVIARTWTAVDECGNAATGVQTITVSDTTAPVLTVPADVTLECPANTDSSATGEATATDLCGTVTISHTDNVTANCGATKVIKRAWKAVDQCGNVATGLQTITVKDTIPPVLTVPADRSLECPASTDASATGMATATDACGNVTVTFVDDVKVNCGGAKVITRNWKAVDQCGNLATGVQTITLKDTTPPVLTVPANITLECPADTSTNRTGTAKAQDACGTATVTYNDAVISTGCGGTKVISRSWTAVDACGNAANGTQTITVRDTTPPVLTTPRDLVLDCPADTTTNSTGTATAKDACGTATVSYSDAVTPGCGSSKVILRTWKAVDDCGNTSTANQKITVQDTTAPLLTCPPSVVLECPADMSTNSTGTATAHDACDSDVTIAYTDASVPSSYDIKLYAADPAESSAPYLPTYLKLAPGNLPCPDTARLTGRALDPLRNAVAYGPTASTLDALTSMGAEPMRLGQVVPFEAVIGVSGAPGPEHGTIEFSASWSTHTTSNDEFGYDKNYMVYCAFVDTADRGTFDPDNNARVESFSSTLIGAGTIDEKIKGTFRVSGLDTGDKVVVEIWVVLMSKMPDHVGGTIAADLVSAQKVMTPPQAITIGTQTISIGNLSKLTPLSPPQEQPPLPPQPPQPPRLYAGPIVSVTDRTWTATDDCGNRSTCVQRLTVIDSTSPAISVPPSVTLECPADTSTNATGTATASDSCGSVKLSYADVVTGGCGGTKVISRLWTASDEWGHVTNAMQTITVADTTPPVLITPSDITLECPANTEPSATGAATATDACGTANVSFTDDVKPGCGATKLITRTWKAVDLCGNVATGVQTITVKDTIPPVLTVPANIVLGSTGSTEPSATGMATAIDACGTTEVSFADSVDNQADGTKVITRNWKAIDLCNNIATGVQTITVKDTIAPVLTVPANVVLGSTDSTDPSATGMATATDASGIATVTFTDSTQTLADGTKVITRTWKAVDASGNIATGIQTITVKDSLPPTITVPSTKTVAPGEAWSFDEPVASDNSGSVTVQIVSTVTNVTDTTTTITRTWEATDASGNTATCSQTVIIVGSELIPPTITASQDPAPGGQGTCTVLTANTEGDGPFTYQWQFDGTDIPGATNSTLSLCSMDFTNAGAYTVVITQGQQSVTSNPALINVGPVLQMQQTTGGIVLTWPAPFILQAADVVTGPYTDVAGATSPHFESTTAPQRFFRLRGEGFSLQLNPAENGQMAITVTGPPGVAFILQASADQLNWAGIMTNTAPATFFDSMQLLAASRYYRIELAPVMITVPATGQVTLAEPQAVVNTKQSLGTSAHSKTEAGTVEAIALKPMR